MNCLLGPWAKSPSLSFILIKDGCRDLSVITDLNCKINLLPHMNTPGCIHSRFLSFPIQSQRALYVHVTGCSTVATPNIKSVFLLQTVNAIKSNSPTVTVYMCMFSVQMKTSVSFTALRKTLTSSLPCPARSKMAPLALITREMSALMECVRYTCCCLCVCVCV